jgi:hypothetical protein
VPAYFCCFLAYVRIVLVVEVQVDYDKKEKCMDIREVRKIAKGHGIKSEKMKKGDIIRAIQRAEGNFDCFGSARSGECSQTECLWRKDCLLSV